MKLTVNLGKDSYPILIEQGLMARTPGLIAEAAGTGKIAIVSDDNVFPIYGDALKQAIAKTHTVIDIVVPHGETSKRFDILPELYSALLEGHMTRTDTIIALGGGVIGDLAGMAAATYLRGVNLIQIPTSLLAQVDSSVGGKVAVDLAEGKNLAGAFKHPRMVLIDPLTLKTLDPRFITDGMGEVIKYGCIKDVNLFDQLAGYDNFDDLFQNIDEIITRCVDIKRDVVEKDLYDFGDRLCLNFGHTIGHAIEQYYHYERYSHGEGVAIGMRAITDISEKRGLTAPGTSARIQDVLSHYGLPLAAGVKSELLLDAISRDKKNIHNNLTYVILKSIGDYDLLKDSREMILEKEVI